MPDQTNNRGADPVTRPTAKLTYTALGILAAAALIAGIAARFKGLGTWPLAWDEYYLAQSVQFVLHTGLPEYPCGGFYSRGLLVQYLAAGLQLAGMSAELAPRFIAAVSSLTAIAAAFRIARRCGGLEVALLTVAMLALSVWEVEIGRFGRMYAPFQAAFLWYVVFFLDYTIDRRTRALIPMVILSMAGVLIWEGGALLALANFLPPFIRQSLGRDAASASLDRRDLTYLALAALLFLPAYWFATADLRVMGTAPTLPADYISTDDGPVSPLDLNSPPWHSLARHLPWLLAALLPLTAVLFAGRWLLEFRSRPITALGLAAALGAALLQQFLLCGVVIVLLVLLRLLDIGALVTRGRTYLLALAACLVFWSAFGLATHDWHSPGISIGRTAGLLMFEFVRFPDVIRQVIVPWAHALPALGAILAVLLAVETLRLGAGQRGTPWQNASDSERAILIIVIVMLVAASAADTPRHETRYVFFLYPLALIVALTGVFQGLRLLLKERIAGGAVPAAIAAALCVAGFLMTEDFRPQHLLQIDTADVSFRQKMSPREAAQYPARADLSGAAGWLRQHVSPGRDLVINGFPGVDFYYPHADYFFMETSDERFESWSCAAGSLERWSNLPLLYSIDSLGSAAASRAQVWLVIESSRRARVLERLQRANPTLRVQLEWVGRNPGISIVSLSSTKDPA